MKHKALYLYLILFFLLCCSVTTTGQEKKQERFTLMGLGDSITEGADFFTCYLYPLWEKLFTAGYQFDFIGPRESKCRIGTLNHCGFSGKNVEFLESRSTAFTGFIRQILYCSMPVITILRKRNLFPE